MLLLILTILVAMMDRLVVISLPTVVTLNVPGVACLFFQVALQ
jgi:hypothetical protein